MLCESVFYDDIEDCSFKGNVKFIATIIILYLGFLPLLLWEWLFGFGRLAKAKK